MKRPGGLRCWRSSRAVRRAGDQIRVNAQLIDAQTDAHLWAEQFDREMGDLFALQARSPAGSRSR
jgi:TolB-like protein